SGRAAVSKTAGLPLAGSNPALGASPIDEMHSGGNRDTAELRTETAIHPRTVPSFRALRPPSMAQQDDADASGHHGEPQRDGPVEQVHDRGIRSNVPGHLLGAGAEEPDKRHQNATDQDREPRSEE